MRGRVQRGRARLRNGKLGDSSVCVIKEKNDVQVEAKGSRGEERKGKMRRSLRCEGRKKLMTTRKSRKNRRRRARRTRRRNKIRVVRSVASRLSPSWLLPEGDAPWGNKDNGRRSG